VPLHTQQELADHAPQTEQNLLSLLAAGHTDRTIAESLVCTNAPSIGRFER